MEGGGAQDVAVEFMLGLNSGFWRVNGGKKLGFLCTTDVLPISHHDLRHVLTSHVSVCADSLCIHESQSR